MQGTGERVKEAACEVGGCETFTELAALLMARRLVSKGRVPEARRILEVYLAKYPPTAQVEEALFALQPCP